MAKEPKLNEKHTHRVDIDAWIEKNRSESDEFRKAYDEARAETLLARKMAAARVAAHLTQAEVAKRMGTNQAAVSRMERASYTGHKVSLVHRFAAAVECEADITFRPIRAPATVSAKRSTAPKGKKR
jgi:DNA-binding XRE family transcriptional regulator